MFHELAEGSLGKVSCCVFDMGICVCEDDGVAGGSDGECTDKCRVTMVRGDEDWCGSNSYLVGDGCDFATAVTKSGACGGWMGGGGPFASPD